MTIDRTHSSKYVLIGFEGDDLWEEWHFRFNRGNKMFKPVKCDFSRVWHSDKSRTRISFAVMRWSDSSEKKRRDLFCRAYKEVRRNYPSSGSCFD